MRLGLVLGVVLAATVAAAAPGERAPRTLALLRFRGPSAEAVQHAVLEGLGKQRGLTAVSLRGKRPQDSELELARQAGAVCALSGTVEPGRFRVVRLRVVAVPGGQLLQEVSLSTSGARGLGQLQRVVSKRLANGLEDCRALPLPGEAPPVAEAPKPAASEPAPAPSASDAAPATPPSSPPTRTLGSSAPVARRPLPAASSPQAVETPSSLFEARQTGPVLLDASLGASSLLRFLRYSDDLFGALREYNLPLSALGALHIDAYPAARRGGLLAHLGLTASAEQSLLLRSGAKGGPAFPTNAQRIAFGLLGRTSVRGAEVTLSGAYGWQDFSISGDGDPARPEIPNVTYRFLRVGAAARADVTARVAVLASAAYLHILDSGQIATSDYFPRLTVAGLEAGAGAAWRFSAPWEVRVGVDYRRYFFSLHPEPGDRLIAGGALDHYVVATLALGLRLR